MVENTALVVVVTALVVVVVVTVLVVVVAGQNSDFVRISIPEDILLILNHPQWLYMNTNS